MARTSLDKIPDLVRTSNTIATWGIYTVNTAASGVGGLDTGAIAASTFYYVYAVAGGIVASLSASAPTGFSSYRKIGALYTNASSQIFKAYYAGEVNQLIYSAYINSSGTVSQENGDWISGNVTMNSPSNTNNITLVSGIFSLRPSFVVTVDDGSLGTVMSKTDLANSSATTLRYITQNSAANSYNQQASHIVAAKQGVDAIQPDWR